METKSVVRQHMTRWLAIALGSLVLALLCLSLWFGKQHAISGTGLMAKQLCSLVFVTGLDADLARQQLLEPIAGPLQRQFRHKVLSEPTSVEVSGLTEVATALYRQGYGCTLLPEQAQDINQLQPLTEVVTLNRQVEGVDVQVREQHFDPSALEEALSRAFEEPKSGSSNQDDKPQANDRKERQTLAIAVRYQGALIAERYAPGLGPNTALPGWAMATSATITLAGLLEHQGLVAVTDNALFDEWSATDNRSKITLDHLLRMTSGLSLEQTGSELDDNSTMLFHNHNAAAFALEQGMQALPGNRWHYSGGNTVLAAHYLTQKAGGPAQMYTQIRELFDTLGMHTAVLEPDASGTFLGSSFMLASARDWSKLGQLYLQQGIWQQKRLLPEGWVDYVTSKTSAADPHQRYGAGFWLAADSGIYSQQNVPALPPSTFSARGRQGQAMHIIPSEGLVVVRMGATSEPWSSGEWDLVADIIAARRD